MSYGTVNKEVFEECPIGMTTEDWFNSLLRKEDLEPKAEVLEAAATAPRQTWEEALIYKEDRMHHWGF